MKVRSVLLAVALCCGLVTLGEAKTKKVVVTNAKAMAAARRNAKKQAKTRAAVIHNSAKIRRPVRRPAKH
jgi:hypothetical protein